ILCSLVCVDIFFCFFFFQAEDGIRDDLVTGVQTCALPILAVRMVASGVCHSDLSVITERSEWQTPLATMRTATSFRFGVSSVTRSEERRVGKEGRVVWAAE